MRISSWRSRLAFASSSVAANLSRVDIGFQANDFVLGFDRSGECLLYDAKSHEVRVALMRAFGTQRLVHATRQPVSASAFDQKHLSKSIA